MIEENDKRHISHMIEAIDRLIDCRNKYDLETARNDYMIFDVILMEFENLANHAMKLTEELISSHSEINIKELRAIRNRIAHDYLSVQIEILYDAIDKDLPSVKQVLTELIK